MKKLIILSIFLLCISYININAQETESLFSISETIPEQKTEQTLPLSEPSSSVVEPKKEEPSTTMIKENSACPFISAERECPGCIETPKTQETGKSAEKITPMTSMQEEKPIPMTIEENSLTITPSKEEESMTSILLPETETQSMEENIIQPEEETEKTTELPDFSIGKVE